MEEVEHRIGQYTHSYHHGRSGELVYICPLQLDGTVDMVHKDNVCIYFNEQPQRRDGASSGASITFLDASTGDGVEAWLDPTKKPLEAGTPVFARTYGPYYDRSAFGEA
jgi:hypothetical protein